MEDVQQTHRPTTADPRMADPPGRTARSAALDWARLTALAAIFLVHASEAMFGGFRAFNPSGDWGSLAARWAEWAPGHGFAGAATSLFRWVSSLGDMAVGVFIIVTGIALTMSAQRNGFDASDGPSRRRWLGRHLWAIGAAWVLVHFGLALVLWLAGTPKFTMGHWQFWASLLGLRFVPPTMYVGLPAWWYVGMLVQLYLLYPYLLNALRRLGARRFLVWGLATTLALRLVGLLVSAHLVPSMLDVWSRGGIALSRLPELVVGMAIGMAVSDAAKPADEWLRAWLTPTRLLASAGAFVLGFAASFTLAGMAVAPLLTAMGLAAPALGMGARLRPSRWLDLTASRSYDFYLVHHLPIMAVCTTASVLSASSLARVVAALLASLVGAEVLHRLAAWLIARREQISRPRGAAAVALATAASLALVGGAEAVAQAKAPAENLGWGERPYLVPDERWGWKQKPSSTVHVRWLGYDYDTTSTADGLPTPPPGNSGHRVMVLGDAFSSANGVEPNESWVSLLPAAAGNRLNVVTNASVTGWGPDQEVRAAEDLIPRDKPEVVVVETFINDLLDMSMTDDDFRQQIGFANPNPSGFPGLLAGANLRQVSVQPVKAELKKALGREAVDSSGYGFLGLMPRQDDPELDAAAAKAGLRFARIKAAADSVGAKVVVVLVPSAVQACKPTDLPYLGSGFNAADYDLDRPQRLLKEQWQQAGVSDVLDLRETLSTGACPYVPDNMHWTRQGHERVAQEVARHLP